MKGILLLSLFENFESLKLDSHCYTWNEDIISLSQSLRNLQRFSISVAKINESIERLNVFNNIKFF